LYIPANPIPVKDLILFTPKFGLGIPSGQEQYNFTLELLRGIIIGTISIKVTTLLSSMWYGKMTQKFVIPPGN
jgi:hypothetical protein